jgi:nucleolar protein 9
LFLIQHRFASHCCEALFLKSAPLVTEELVTPFEVITSENAGVATSMESLFLSVIKELKGNFGYLMTDSFASHTVRILLLVLSGRSLSDQSTRSLIQSKKKENIEAQGKSTDAKESERSNRAVPGSFQSALDEIIEDMVGNLDANYLRALATQPLASPVLQLLLELEFGSTGKQKARDESSLFRQLLPDMPPEDKTVSAQFIRGLLFDPVGSHLLETIVKHAPGRVFKSIWLSQIHPRMASIVKNDSAVHVFTKSLERLSPEDLQDTLHHLIPEISSMLERSRMSVIRLLIERCHVRKIGTEKISSAMEKYYGDSNTSRIKNMLRIDALEAQGLSEQRKVHIESQDNSRLHASLLLQTMLSDDALNGLVYSALFSADTETLILLSKDKYATHVLQQSLALDNASQNTRKKLLQKLLGHAVEMALDPTGSRVLDSIWNATADLHFIRERFAQEVADGESSLRDSFSGRFVWRSWLMDLFTKKRKTWIDRSKQSNSLVQKNKESSTEQQPISERKGIDAARNRFVSNKPSHGQTKIEAVR